MSCHETESNTERKTRLENEVGAQKYTARFLGPKHLHDGFDSLHAETTLEITDV